MTFTLLSPARRSTAQREGKAETIVVVECDGIRERKVSEQVHLRNEHSHIACQACGLDAHIWTDSIELHARHPARCSL